MSNVRPWYNKEHLMEEYEAKVHGRRYSAAQADRVIEYLMEESRDLHPHPRRGRTRSLFDVDVVHATQANVLDSARCLICKKAYKKTDAVIRSRNLKEPSTPAQTMHRRCVEALLSSSVEDVPKENVKFERYRQQVADKHGIEV
jgi:hypothetical protein